MTREFKSVILTGNMNISSRSLYLPIVFLVAALSFGLCAYAAETPREELVHAFRLLKRANHDYAGHRAKAMEHVEAAGRALGLELGGDLAEHERQWKSDAQLKEARRLLRHCRAKLEERDRTRVAARVNKAIEEINLALQVK